MSAVCYFDTGKREKVGENAIWHGNGWCTDEDEVVVNIARHDGGNVRRWNDQSLPQTPEVLVMVGKGGDGLEGGSPHHPPSDGTERSIVEEHGLDEPGWPRSPITGVPRPDEEFVCSVAEALNPDDEAIINDRSRPLTVLGFEEQSNPGVLKPPDYPYYIWWLRGNGTEYRLRWSHRGDGYPHLNTESELETRESYSVKHGELRQKTVATCRGKRVAWIRPVDVDEKDLSDWVLSRSIEGFETADPSSTGSENDG